MQYDIEQQIAGFGFALRRARRGRLARGPLRGCGHDRRLPWAKRPGNPAVRSYILKKHGRMGFQ